MSETKIPRTKYQRGVLALELAKAIQERSEDPHIQELARSMQYALAAPAQIFKNRYPHFRNLIDYKHEPECSMNYEGDECNCVLNGQPVSRSGRKGKNG